MQVLTSVEVVRIGIRVGEKKRLNRATPKASAMLGLREYGQGPQRSAGVARSAVEGGPATKKGRGIVWNTQSAMPSRQLDPCRDTLFDLRQGRAALLPLSRSGHG